MNGCKQETIHRDRVVSLSQAAKCLPMRHTEAVSLLRASGLVRDLDGRSVVWWGEVLEALARGELGARPGSAKHRPNAPCSLPYVDLDS